jgi:hypothetical protein
LGQASEFERPFVKDAVAKDNTVTQVVEGEKSRRGEEASTMTLATFGVN